MDLRQVAVFVQAVRGGSLSEGARRLGVTPAMASRALAALEHEVGARLAHRSTRSFALTSDGEAFLPHAEALLEAARLGREAIAGEDAQVDGLLRVGAPIPLTQRVVVPLLADLLARHPKLRVDLQASDALVDVVASGLDVTLRVGALMDSELVARRLAPSPRLVCAAPSYLARRGRPTTVEDLAHHDCLVRSGAGTWAFEDGARTRTVRVEGRLLSNSHLPLRTACLAGVGIAVFSRWDAQGDLNAGRLEALELDLRPASDVAIWAVFPSRTLVPARVRVFTDAVARALSPAPAAID